MWKWRCTVVSPHSKEKETEAQRKKGVYPRLSESEKEPEARNTASQTLPTGSQGQGHL